RDLPAGTLSRLQSRPDLLERLVPGERTESVDEGCGFEQTPKLFRAAPRQGVFDDDVALQAPNIAERVITRNPLPAGIIGPIMIGFFHFIPVLSDTGTAFPFCFARPAHLLLGLPNSQALAVGASAAAAGVSRVSHSRGR